MALLMAKLQVLIPLVSLVECAETCLPLRNQQSWPCFVAVTAGETNGQFRKPLNEINTCNLQKKGRYEGKKEKRPRGPSICIRIYIGTNYTLQELPELYTARLRLPNLPRSWPIPGLTSSGRGRGFHMTSAILAVELSTW